MEQAIILSGDASDFVSISDIVPDVILDIRYYSTYNFVGDRIDGYEEPLAFLTREAAEALRVVSNEFVAKGYRLRIFDAYRPQMADAHFVKWTRDTGDTRMKSGRKAALRGEIRGAVFYYLIRYLVINLFDHLARCQNDQ